MNIPIPQTAEFAVLKYDLYGNLYFEYNEGIYNVVIGHFNHPELLKVKPEKLTLITEDSVEFYTGKLQSGVPSLRGMIEDEMEQYADGEDDEEVNNEYYPEKKFFYTDDIQVDTDYSSSVDIEPMFHFYNHKPELLREYGFPYNSLYNFLVVQGTKESKNIVLSSNEFNNTCAYRITVYTVGLLKCNVVGSYEGYFKLSKDKNGELELEPDVSNGLAETIALAKKQKQQQKPIIIDEKDLPPDAVEIVQST